MMTDSRKLKKTTTWLREPRDRFGGGVPISGRSASLAVRGTIGDTGADRRPNSSLFAGSLLIRLSALSAAFDASRETKSDYGKIRNTRRASH
jgi:hypothetical protein